MTEEFKLRIKHKVLRYRAEKRRITNIVTTDLEILNFAMAKLRTSEHLIVTDDLIRATKGSFILSMEHGRLIGLDSTANSIMDVRVSPALEKQIKLYASKVDRYRTMVFNKKCIAQIQNLMNGFQD